MKDRKGISDYIKEHDGAKIALFIGAIVVGLVVCYLLGSGVGQIVRAVSN